MRKFFVGVLLSTKRMTLFIICLFVIFFFIKDMQYSKQHLVCLFTLIPLLLFSVFYAYAKCGLMEEICFLIIKEWNIKYSTSGHETENIQSGSIKSCTMSVINFQDEVLDCYFKWSTNGIYSDGSFYRKIVILFFTKKR